MKQKFVVVLLYGIILSFATLAFSQPTKNKESKEKAEPATKLEQFLSKKADYI